MRIVRRKKIESEQVYTTIIFAPRVARNKIPTDFDRTALYLGRFFELRSSDLHRLHTGIIKMSGKTHMMPV